MAGSWGLQALFALVLLLASSALADPAPPPPETTDESSRPAIRVHFLGTGGPEITRDRMGAATLIEANGQKFLFDAGRGVLQRLGESRLDIPAVDEVFFTHLHSDHIEGLPALWMTSWFITKRNTPMTFRGPPGTRAALDGLRAFMGHDLVARVNPVVRASGTEMIVEETAGGVVLDRDGVRIRAIPAAHGDGDPSLAYLFEYGGRSVLITGDSTYTKRFGEEVADVDLTVCNVYAPSLALLAHLDDHAEPIPTVVRAVAAKLASPEQAAAMFRETGARLGVYSHNIFYDSTPAQVIARTRAAGFTGEILVAEDRMYVDLGSDLRVHEAPQVPPDLEINSLNFRAVLHPGRAAGRSATSAAPVGPAT